MKSGYLAILALSLSVAGGTAASAGSAALALAAVVAQYSPLPSAQKRTVAAFFEGRTNVGCSRKIEVTADKIVCRISDVDITARSCQLTFKNSVRSLKGREANELYATEVMNGVPSDGAAGSIFESLSKLKCTLDPKALKEKGGAGAECTYDPGG